MRSLKYAILGLINREPITGYDISKEFSHETMANFWYANHSQVYPELKKLTDEGSVEFEVIIQGEKLKKKLYSITEKGKKELMEWLLTDEQIGPTQKDIFRLRSYFSDNIPANDYISLLNSQVRMHTQRFNYLKEVMSSTYSDTPDIGTTQLGDYMLLEGAIIRENAYIMWLNRCLKIYNKGR